MNTFFAWCIMHSFPFVSAIYKKRIRVRQSFKKLLSGHHLFKQTYTRGNNSLMSVLSEQGQKPETMVVACSDSRVDPALLLQAQPGELFTVRNVANLIPHYQKEGLYPGNSAALEFGVCVLQVKHLIIMGHSQCGGIEALAQYDQLQEQDFMAKWVSMAKASSLNGQENEVCAKKVLLQSYQNCFTFPWIKQRVESGQLSVHAWFFDIKSGSISAYSEETTTYCPLL